MQYTEVITVMKRVTATIEFVLDGEDELLKIMNNQELAVEISDLLESERGGMAEFGSAGVRSIQVDEI
jgi:hypothetical protein